MVATWSSLNQRLPDFSFTSTFTDDPFKTNKVHGAVTHLRTGSAEPFASEKIILHPRGSQSVDVQSTAREEVTGTPDKYDEWTAARAALSAKKRKQSKNQSRSSIHSVSALRHLCSKCQAFPLEACMTAPEPGRIWTSPLKRLIWHKNDCPLCSLLIRALCQPEYDPFKHAEVFLHLSAELRTASMDSWLADISEEDALSNTTASWNDLKKWPFGTQILGTRELDNDSEVQGAAAQGFIAVEPQDVIGSDDHRAKESNVMTTLPCYITISNNLLTSGLLDVQFWGYGRGQKARIAPLSSFRLRIESDASHHLTSESSTLAYGRILDPSQIDLFMGRIWLDHCERNHGSSCSKQGWPFRLGKPDFFRLIDVEDLSIIEITSSQAWSYRYLTLSYVRGSTQTFQLLHSNKHKLMRPHGLLKYFPNNLSKTLRDAINVTRGFEERYLWIDSLCIEQDNELDRHEQINMMDRIFGNALLTIVAADADNADAGLGGVERGSRHIHQISEEIQPDIRIMLPLPPLKELNSSPWAQRAWTFQERLYSRRLVIFTQDQIYWRCHKCAASEDMTATEASPILTSYPWLNIKPQQLGVKMPKDAYSDCSLRKLHDGTTHVMRSGAFKEYAQLVQQYSRRQLSHDAEILCAIAGLLHVFKLCFKGPIRQGLPQVLLDSAILWRPAERLTRRDCATVSSWSWAGWKGEVKYASSFQVQAKEDWSLHRVASSTGQEFFRPLLRWYVWRDHELQPINGNGFGIPLEATTRHLPGEWDKYPPLMSNGNCSNFDEPDLLGHWDDIMEDIESLVLDPATLAENKLQIHATDLLPAVLPLLGPKHLIFRTSCSTALRFGRIARSAVIDPKIPLKYPLISDTSGKEIGSVRLDGSGPREFDPTSHAFVVISEALYLEIGQDMPKDGKDNQYPLYNIMLVEWTKEGMFAARLGLGRVFKEDWKTLEPAPEPIIVILE